MPRAERTPSTQTQSEAYETPAPADLDLPKQDEHASVNAIVSPQKTELALPRDLEARYEFIRELGTGTQGTVFQAKRRSDGVLTAIKLLRIDSVKTWKEYTLFHREAEILASLNIPGTAKFYEASDYLDNNPPYSCIVQEFIEGATLKQALRSGYRFSLDQIFDIALQLIDILAKLHTHHPPVIHRDIKPSNIILQPKGNAYKVFLIDFGAVANPQIQSGGSTIAGTYGYMSPEQHIGRPTPQSDTYALAALLSYMLSGIDPAEMKIQNLRLIIDPYIENHPPALVQTLRRMLDPNIDKRLADLNELRTRFQQFKKGKYILDNDPCQQFSPEEFKKRLLSVKSLGESQNLDIWQNLPDQTDNRNIFPFKIKTNPRFRGYTTENTAITTIFPILLAISGIMFLVSFPIIFMNSKLAANIGGGLLVTSLVLFIICAHLIRNPVRIQSFKYYNWACPPIMPDSINKTMLCPIHERIYQQGRKTIATITQISYIPYNNKKGFKDNKFGIRHRLETPPTFKIWYKFNPPDDDNPDDIIHSITLHRDPRSLIKVGDSLPILYHFRFLDRGHRKIISMPYPFPLEDLEFPEDYLGDQHAITF